MRTLTLRAFLVGPSAWRSQNRWHPLLAVLAAIGVVVAGQLAPIVVLALMRGDLAQSVPSGRVGEETLYQFAEGAGAPLLLLSQSMLALLTIAVASLYRGRFSEVLCLVRPDGGGRAYAFALLLLVPLLAAINAVAYWLSPAGFLADFKQFASLARTPQPVTAFLAIAVGAPLWEEMLFRGFLVGPIAGWIGFWPAAVLISGAWTALHLGYSAVGLAEVFLIGLYFSWLLWRTGSLWVPIACHAIYNGCLFVALRYLPV
jgi:membrane protease YdiL (CAAX protease family)